MRYVVLVKPPDDHPSAVKIMGVFKERSRAEDLCRKIREAVEREDRWLDETTGYAYVLILNEPRVRYAVRWALRGE